MTRWSSSLPGGIYSRGYPKLQARRDMSSAFLLLPRYGISCKGGSGSSQSLNLSAASTVPSPSVYSPYGLLSPVDHQGSSAAASSQNLLHPAVEQALPPTEHYHGLHKPVANQGAAVTGSSQSLLLPVADQNISVAKCIRDLLQPLASRARSVKAKTHVEPSLASRMQCLQMQGTQAPVEELSLGNNKGANGKEAWRDWVVASRVPSLFEAGDQPTLIPSPDKDFDLNSKTALESGSTVSFQSLKTPDAPDVPQTPPPDVYYLPATTYVPPKSRLATKAANVVERVEGATKTSKTTKDERRTNQQEILARIESDGSVHESKPVLDNVRTSDVAKTVLHGGGSMPKRPRRSWSVCLMNPSAQTAEKDATSEFDLVNSAAQPTPVFEKEMTCDPIKDDLTWYEVFIPIPKLIPLPAETWKRKSPHFIITRKEFADLESKAKAGQADRCKVYVRSDTSPQRRGTDQSPKRHNARSGNSYPPLRLQKELPRLPASETNGGEESQTPTQGLVNFDQAAVETSKQTEELGKGKGRHAKVWKVSEEGLETIKQALGLIERPNLGSWMDRRIKQIEGA